MTDTATIERGPAAPGSTLPDALLYIDGNGGRTFDVISPWTGEVVGKAADANADDVNAAITAARRAFDETDWGSPENRQNRLDLVKKYARSVRGQPRRGLANWPCTKPARRSARSPARMSTWRSMAGTIT
jgi:hypothetical protein